MCIYMHIMCIYIYILNETINWVKSKKQEIMIFKTDISKAYDSVSWLYLDQLIINAGNRFWSKMAIMDMGMLKV